MLQLLLQSAGAFLLVWVAWNLHLGLRRRYGPRLDFPVVGTPNDRDYKAALREGYQKVVYRASGPLPCVPEGYL